MFRLNPAAYPKLLHASRLIIGLSGGLDSTVLLHLLASDPKLSHKLHAVHIHHGMSPHADDWLLHCEAFCEQHGVQFTAKTITFDDTSNFEARAREARHGVFSELMQANDVLLLAHHQNDQAETVLLNLLRGTGINGLAAMPLIQPFAKGEMIRPLLHHTREALEAYASLHKLDFVTDDSNQNITYSRNYIRHEIMPKLTARFPSAIEAIARGASHAASASHDLVNLAYLDCPDLSQKSTCLALNNLYALSRSRLINILRVWLKQNNIPSPDTQKLNLLVKQVIFAKPDANPMLKLADVMIRRYQDALYLVTHSLKPLRPKNILPGHDVRFRAGGEQMRWRGHARSLKYIFQALNIPPWMRDTIPLVFVENTLVAISDFAIADGYTKEDIYDTV